MGWAVYFPALSALWAVFVGGMVGVYWKQQPESDKWGFIHGVGITFPILPAVIMLKSAETREQFLIVTVVAGMGIPLFFVGHWLTTKSPLKDVFKG